MTVLHDAEVPWRLHTTLEVDRLRRDLAAMSEIQTWVREFLAQPHPDLGRPGAVCPFVPRALQLDTIWMAVARPESPNPKEVKEIVARYREVFLNLPPTTGEDSLYKAILIIFPDVPTEEAPYLIDRVQMELKPHFVDEGMMIGEFHKLNAAPGLHNPDFFPLRSPLPMLAMRFMVESDLVFLMREMDAPETRVHFLKSFLRRFESVLPDKRLGVAREALATAERELAEKEGLYA